MRSALTGSTILKFDPKSLWRKAFRESPVDLDKVVRVDETPLYSPNKLTKSHAIYVSEPDEIRKCIEKQSPNQNFCLILTNKSI